jgi:dihydrofolate reductase
MMQHGLIDEYQFWVYPVVVGGGTRLFGNRSSVTLKLVATRMFSAGVAVLTYQPVRSA